MLSNGLERSTRLEAGVASENQRVRRPRSTACDVMLRELDTEASSRARVCVPPRALREDKLRYLAT